jgi:ATP-dependent Clp protease protease subunit
MTVTKAQKSKIIEETHSYGINSDTREIFLWGEIDRDTALTFIGNLSLLNSFGKDNILVHMSSIGGEWTDGMGMYDAISNSVSHVTCLGYGDLCSMGTIIIQAADRRILMPNTLVLIHDGSSTISGTHKQILSGTDFERVTYEKMMDIYLNKCTDGQFFKDYTERRIRNFIKQALDTKEDWYLPAKEAVSYGFADGVLGEETFEDVKSLRLE